MDEQTLEMLKRLDGATVVGMRKTYYVGAAPGEGDDGTTCDNYNPMHKETCAKYEIMLIASRTHLHYIIEIKNSRGWCGSGYCTASWYNLNVHHCYDGFGPMTHKVKSPSLYLVVNKKDPEAYWMCEADGFSTNLFTIQDNDDGYYPDGWVTVNEELFELLPRAINRRPVWIFAGESGLGKSTIGMLLSQNKTLTVYETDKSNTLPDIIYADIVVLGNKYNFDLREIKERLFDDPKVILVDFKAQN